MTAYRPVPMHRRAGSLLSVRCPSLKDAASGDYSHDRQCRSAKLPPQAAIAEQVISARPGNQLDMNDLASRLERNGFERVSTVRDIGEFAVRGGILDLYAPGAEEPLRLDFFGDTLESIRAFDPASQRTTGTRKEFVLQPMSEITLSPDMISRFRKNYVAMFGRPSAKTRFIRPSAKAAALQAWNTGCRCSMISSIPYSIMQAICRWCSTIWSMRR